MRLSGFFASTVAAVLAGGLTVWAVTQAFGQVLIVGNDEKQGWDENAKPILKEPGHNTLPVIDISKHGAKVQYAGDDIALKNGDKVVCMFHLGASKEVALELMCTVVRAEKTGKTRTLWNFGIDFPLMKDPQVAKLKELGKLAD